MPRLKQIIFLVLFVSMAANAVFTSILFAHEGFFRANQVPLNLRPILFAFPAAVSIQSRATNPQAPQQIHDCSGVFISNKGHVLTALHCILPSLPPSLVRTHTSANASWQTIEDQTPQNLRLPGVSTSEGLTNPQVIVLGRGAPHVYPRYDVSRGLNANDDELQNLNQNAEDFAILKFDVSLYGSPCIEGSISPRSTIGSVYSIGFPMETHRGGLAANAPGQEAVFSRGAILRGFSETAWARSENLNSTARRRLARGLLPPGYFLNDLDGNDGSSGEMILDQAGNLVGIFTSTNSNTTHYEQGLSYGLLLSAIRASTYHLMGLPLGAEAFACNHPVN